MKLKSIRNAIIAPLIAISCMLQADTVTIPNSFTANTPAIAEQVNANFNAVKISVDDNDARIDSLLAAVSQLQTDLATANSQISTLTTSLETANSDIDALSAGLFSAVTEINSSIVDIEANTVLALDGKLTLSTINGFETAEFTDINVQINNGSDSTGGVVNGLGNLTIGYNETNAAAQEFCSNPNELTEPDCINNGDDWLVNVRSGSHNLVLGNQNSYTSHSGIIAGQDNVSNSLFSSVLGGRNNRVDTEWSVVVGGRTNVVRPNVLTGPYSSILGGFQNIVFGTYSTISGGQSNTASSYFSSVSGGQTNSASGDHSSVSGGDTRSAIGAHDWRAGGLFETD